MKRKVIDLYNYIGVSPKYLGYKYLVDETVMYANDVINNKEEYHIDNVDKKIDFRRVKNLRVFFKKYAVNLTLDLKDIADWQGGDIVVFEKHVGIISDKRNKRGVPLVIHHYSIFQKSYEEDILEYRNDIVGHYRMS